MIILQIKIVTNKIKKESGKTIEDTDAFRNSEILLKAETVLRVCIRK